MTLEELLARPRPPFVLLDANVMLPNYLRHVLLDLGENGLLVAHWSKDILTEVRRNLIKPNFGLGTVQVDRLLHALQTFFPGAQVRGYKPLIAQFLGQTDPKDAHVAAAALRLSQNTLDREPAVLLTSNVKHLPQKAFSSTAVLVSRPDRFLTLLLACRPHAAIVVDKMRASLKAPPTSREQLLQVLDRSTCKTFASALRTAWTTTTKPS